MTCLLHLLTYHTTKHRTKHRTKHMNRHKSARHKCNNNGALLTCRSFDTLQDCHTKISFEIKFVYESPVMCQTARPYESCKVFKGRPRRNASSKLVHRQNKSFPPDRFCQVEIKNTTGLSNKPSTA